MAGGWGDAGDKERGEEWGGQGMERDEGTRATNWTRRGLDMIIHVYTMV